MTTVQERKNFYFDSKGPINTDTTLDIALECCKEQKIQKIVVASSTGETALKLLEKAPDEADIIAGSHRGADTAVVLKPAYAANMFETKIKALLCMPS